MAKPMDPAIVGAIVGGVIAAAATILAPIVTIVISRWLNARDLKTITHSTRMNIEGFWDGHLELSQPPADWPAKVPISGPFRVKRKKVIGTLTFKGPQGTFELSFDGGFYVDRVLMLTYRNKNENVKQFGNAVMELSSQGDRLTGKIMGFGSVSNEIVASGISLEYKGRQT